MKGIPLGLITAGLVTAAAIASYSADLKFETHALLLQAETPTSTEGIRPPVLTVRCHEPNCGWNAMFYELLVDDKGQVQDLRFDDEIVLSSAQTRADAEQAIRHARWEGVKPGRPIRTHWQVEVLPPVKTPTRHIPFPDTDGKPISITLERTACFGSCPSYLTILRNDGTVYFCGRSDVRALGWHSARISPAEFDQLLRRFRDADFFSLDDEYAAKVTDNPAYIIGVRVGDESKVVHDYVGDQVGMPPVVTQLQQAVDAAAKTGRWIGSRQPPAGGEWSGIDCSTAPTPFNG